MSRHDDMTLQNEATKRRSGGGWLRHAFAVDDPSDFVPTEEQREMVDDVCRWMVRRGMTTAALMGIEMHRPANYIVANIMHFFRPTVSLTLPVLHLLPIIRRALPDMKRYRAFADMLEHRGAAEYMTMRLESFESETIQGRQAQAGRSKPPEEPQAPLDDS